MRPDSDVGADRFPVTIIELPPGSELAPHANTEDLFFNVLAGELTFGGDPIGVDAMAYIDAGNVHPVTAGPQGATFMLISKALGTTIYPPAS